MVSLISLVIVGFTKVLIMFWYKFNRNINSIILFLSWMKSPPLLNVAIRKEYSRTPEPVDSRYNYRSRSISKQNNRFVFYLFNVYHQINMK